VSDCRLDSSLRPIVPFLVRSRPSHSWMLVPVVHDNNTPLLLLLLLLDSYSVPSQRIASAAPTRPLPFAAPIAGPPVPVICGVSCQSLSRGDSRVFLGLVLARQRSHRQRFVSPWILQRFEGHGRLVPFQREA
jgi:hypothetical protein